MNFIPIYMHIVVRTTKFANINLLIENFFACKHVNGVLPTQTPAI